MPIDRWMNKEVVVHIHNGILLNHKKECIWVSSNKIDESRAYYTEWSKSERERWILYSNIYTESRKIILKNYFQGNNGEADIDNRLMDMGRGEETVRCMERVTWKLTFPYVKQIANGNLLYGSGNSTGALYQPREVGWGGRFKTEGICVYLWLIHVEVWQKTAKLCKAVILQLKRDTPVEVK